LFGLAATSALADPPYPPAVERAVSVAVKADDPHALAAVVGANPMYAAQIVAIGVSAHPNEAAQIAAYAASEAPQVAPQIAAAAAVANPKAAAQIAGSVTAAVPAAGKASGDAILKALPAADLAGAAPAVQAAVKDHMPDSPDDNALKGSIDPRH
jgi:hypothetical protein